MLEAEPTARCSAAASCLSPTCCNTTDQLDEIDLLTGKIHALSEVLECKAPPAWWWRGRAGDRDRRDDQHAESAAYSNQQLGVVRRHERSGSLDADRAGLRPRSRPWSPCASRSSTTFTRLGMGACPTSCAATLIPTRRLGAAADQEPERLEFASATSSRNWRGWRRISSRSHPEIITEKFQPETIITDMSQTTLPTQRMQQQQVMQIQQQPMHGAAAGDGDGCSSSSSSPRRSNHLAYQTPPPDGDPMAAQIEQIQQQMQMGMAEIDKIKQQPNIEQVLQFLGDNRATAFYARYRDRQYHRRRRAEPRRRRAPSSCRCWAACCRN